MGVKLSREKPKNLLLSVIYRIGKKLPLSRKMKFRLFLDLEWIFDRLSHEMSFKMYSEEKHPVRTYSRAFILEQIKSHQNVLDLGCKYGEVSYYVAERANKVVGIDYDEAAIKIARKKYQRDNLTFELGEAYEYLEKPSNSFDVLILSHILEHLDDPKEFLLKFRKHFKYIYIEVPDFDRHYLNHYRKDQNIKLIYSDNDHISEFDRFELRNLLKECGIHILKEEYIFGIQKIWCEVDNSF